MDHRLLRVARTILRLIYDKKLWVNTIIEQTSRDRSYVIQVLDDMEKARLLRQGPRAIGKKRPVEITPLGSELASFYEDLDNFIKSFFKTVKYRNEIHVESDDKIVKHDRYENLQSLLSSYEVAFFGDLLRIVHHRSLKILHRNKVNLKTKRNEIIQVILEGIILDAIAFTYGNILNIETNTLTRSGREFNLEDWINSTENELVGFLNPWCIHSIPFFAMEEVKKLSYNFLRLIHPSKNALLEEVHELENMIEEFKTFKTTSGLKHVALHPLLETTREYLKKI
jgi:DNA-binding MarR family transcriptional regulator